MSPDGKRQDAAHRFIHPLLQDGDHPNLHILTESKVIRVLFDESTPPRAIGIEYKPNGDHQPELALSKPVHKTIKANKLVVIAAGALGSPQILERSGVGNPDILKKVGISVVADVPVSARTMRYVLCHRDNLQTLPLKSNTNHMFTGRRRGIPRPSSSALPIQDEES